MYWVVHCWDDYGDEESGPMVYDWYEIFEAKDAGEAWIKYRNARPATEKEITGYLAYKAEVQKFKEMGIAEENCPFDIHCFVEFEEI